MKDFILFRTEALEVEPDWLLMEITDTCPEEFYQEAFGAKYGIFSILTAPCELETRILESLRD